MKRRKPATKGKPRKAQRMFSLSKADMRLVKRLQPINETKKYQRINWNAINSNFELASEVTDFTMSLTVPYHIVIPGSFMHMQSNTQVGSMMGGAQNFTVNNLSKTCMDGEEIFSRFLSMKIQVDYPGNTAAPATAPRPVQLIWGFISPPNLTPLTKPTRLTVSYQELLDRVVQAIASDFNEAIDPMKFTDREKRKYNIVGRHTFLPNQTKQISNTSSTWLGTDTAKMRYTCKWPMNKQVRYSFTNGHDPQDPNAGPFDPFHYPNEAYTPFALLFNPDFAAYDVSGVDPIKCKRSDCHWFYDS